MRAVLSEFTAEFPEAKIEKILQPANDEIDMVIHHGRSSSRLLFNVGPNAPRLQLTDKAKENPLKAPMFCMFLRKRLLGARIVGVEQPGFDRIAKLTVSGYDEMGFPTEMKIVCEIIGKYEKYKSVVGEFERFVILADAQQSHSIELVSEEDVQDVIKAVEERIPDNNSVSIAVIWSDANNQVNVTESQVPENINI